jgi:pimeloyl-ACP methyl ester carboxylesterase
MEVEQFSLSPGLAGLATNAEAETILWLHGYTMDSSIWAALWATLPRWRHIGIDLPAHGRSRRLRAGDDLPGIADEIARAAIRLRVRYLVGLSFGTLFVLEMAIQNPKAFQALVLAAPTFGGGPIEPKVQSRNQELMRLYKARGPGPWMTDLWMSSPPDIFSCASQYPAIYEMLRDVIGRHDWRELDGLMMLPLVSHVQTMSQLATIEADTLLLVGEQDMPAFLRSAHLIAGALPRGRVAYLANAGHLCLLENIAAASAAIRDHFRAPTA